MCRNGNELVPPHSKLHDDDRHLSLTALTESIHRAVADLASTHQQQQTIMKTSGVVVSDSNSTSSQVSSPVARKKTDSAPIPEAAQTAGTGADPGGPGSEANPSSASKTARGFPRITLEHPHYVDYASLSVDSIDLDRERQNRSRGGVTSTFPLVLHQMLEDAQSQGFDDIITWLGHGRAWRVIDQERFTKEIMTKYFRQTRFRSFQRQLSLYGFKRLTRKGPECGSYYHELCLRGMPHLSKHIHRQRVKGWMVRQSASPETEPDLWELPIVGIPDPTPIANPKQPSPSGEQCGKEAAAKGGPDCRAMDYQLVPPPLLLSVPSSATQVPSASRSDSGTYDPFQNLYSGMFMPLSIAKPPVESFEEEGDMVYFLSDVDLSTSDDEEDDDDETSKATAKTKPSRRKRKRFSEDAEHPTS